MKRYLWILFFFPVIAGTACGWEFNRNPDRFPSVAFTVENYHTSGDYTAVSQPSSFALVERGGSTQDYLGLGLNLRLPLHQSLTLDMDYMNIDGESTTNRNHNIYRESFQQNGYRSKISMRLFFN